MSYSDVLEMPDLSAADGVRALVAARFINFTTGEFTLQSGHRSWIKEKAVPAILGSPNSWIDIYGYASKRGNAIKNLKLSKDRANSVRGEIAVELMARGSSIENKVNVDHGYGEDHPDYFGKPSDNSGYWRAAELVVFGRRPSVVRRKKPEGRRHSLRSV